MAVSDAAPTELELFHQFQAELLDQGHRDLKPEEVLRTWQEQKHEYAEAVRAIQEGLDDVAAGRVQPLEEFDREFRNKYQPTNHDRTRDIRFT